MENEGLFIDLKVSLAVLKESLDNAGALIKASIINLENTFSQIGDNANIDPLNKQLEEQAALLKEADKSAEELNKEFEKPSSEPIEKTNEKIKDTKKSTDELADKFEKFFGFDANAVLNKFGLSLDKVLKMFTSPAGMIAVIGLVIKKLFDLGKEFDEVFSGIAKRTGKTNEDMKALNQSLINLGQSGVEQSFEEIGAGLAEINARFNLTGVELEDMTALFADFSDVTGQQVAQSVKGASELMSKWGIQVEDTGSLLDKLTKAGQLSGASVGSLTQQLTASAAQFQAAGYSIDESLALLVSFEKAGVRTENVVTGVNKAIGYFSEKGIDAGDGLRALIDSIQKTTSDTEALNMATQVFGMRSGVEFAKAIRSGKFALDEYVTSIQSAEGTVERTDAASQTLGDRLSTLGNQIKARFAPLGGILVDVASKLLDFLIPQLGVAGKQTANLTLTQNQLEQNTNTLKTAVEKYTAANVALNDSTKNLNESQRVTITQEKEIAAAAIVGSLQEEIKSINKLNSEQETTNKKIKDEQTEIEKATIQYNKYKKAKDDLEKSNEEFIQIFDPKTKQYEIANMFNLTELMKKYNQTIVDNTELQADNRVALNNSNKTETKAIEFLAIALNQGSIQLIQLERISQEIANQIKIKADQLSQDAKIIEYATKYANGLMSEKELIALNNAELVKKIKLMAEEIKKKNELVNAPPPKLPVDVNKTKEERDRINAENTKAMITNKIELLNYSRDIEIAAAQKVGADVALINKKYDQLIANEKLKFEEQYAIKSLDNKIDQLEAEKAEAIRAAKEVGANTVLLEKYFDNQIQDEKEKIAKEEEAANKKKLETKAKDNQGYYDSEIDRVTKQAQAEIAATTAAGGDVKAAVDYWNNQILLAKLDAANKAAAIEKAANEKILADKEAAAKKMIADADTILGGVTKIIAKFDQAAADSLEKVGKVGLDVTRIIVSGGTDIGAWVNAIVGGIDLAIEGLKALGNWWDVNINKISKMAEYSKYVFSELQESFQEDIGQAFSNAFEQGIDVGELKKIIGKKILKVAIDAALFSAGVEDKLKKIGDKVAEAIKNGFNQKTLDSINAQVEDIYNTTANILGPLADKINASFDLIEEKVETRMGSFSDYVKTKWEEASGAFADSLGATFTDAFTEGFDLTELRKRIGEQLLQVAIESALFTIGFKDKMEALGQLVADAINSGFTQQSLDAISDQVNQIYEQAATVINPISELIGSTFGNKAAENFGKQEGATGDTVGQQSGVVVNQNLTFNVPSENPIDTKRAVEKSTRNALFDSGLTA